MEILHVRYGFGNKSSLAKVVCGDLEIFALEDERRVVKVPGETCIPVGRYQIELRTEGPKHEDYFTRFPDFHKGMLWIRHISDFTHSYYHIGNWEHQTEGCPLVGLLPQIYPDGEFGVARSKDAYVPFYQKILSAMGAGEDVFTTITEAQPIG